MPQLTLEISTERALINPSIKWIRHCAVLIRLRFWRPKHAQKRDLFIWGSRGKRLSNDVNTVWRNCSVARTQSSDVIFTCLGKREVTWPLFTYVKKRVTTACSDWVNIWPARVLSPCFGSYWIFILPFLHVPIISINNSVIYHAKALRATR